MAVNMAVQTSEPVIKENKLTVFLNINLQLFLHYSTLTTRDQK
jgi:hypothetical protein